MEKIWLTVESWSEGSTNIRITIVKEDDHRRSEEVDVVERSDELSAAIEVLMKAIDRTPT